MSDRHALCVVGGCGGAGATLAAIGLCVAFEARDRPVLLLDMDPERGDIAGGLGAEAPRTIADLAAVMGELTTDHLRTASVVHPAGFALIPGAPELGAARAAELLSAILALPDHPLLVVDAGSGATPVARAAAAAGGPMVLVSPCDSAGCRVARRTAGLLGAPRAGGLIVNQGARTPELSERAVVRAVGWPALASLPRAEREATSLGAGVPDRGRRARLAAVFADVVAAAQEWTS